MGIKLNFVGLGIFLIFFSGSSCSINGGPSAKQKIVEMRVNHYKQTAVGEGSQLVMLVQEEDAIGSENWSYFYDRIEGFDFEPGYIYDLKIRKIEIENPPQDASSIKYILKNIRSKEKVPEDIEFDIGLKRFGTNFVSGSNPEFSLLNEYNIDCVSMCDQMAGKIEDPDLTDVTGTFRHGPDQSLILQSIN